MRLGVSSPEFQGLELAPLLESISREFGLWEIVCENEHELQTLAPRLKRLLPSYDLDLQFHAPFSDINPASGNDRMREAGLREIEDAFALAARFADSPLVTVHPGTVSPAMFTRLPRVVERSREGMARLAESADDIGVRMCVENMPDMKVLFCKDPVELIHVAGGVDLCIDIGHANTTPHLERFLDLARTSGNVHLHDNKGKRDAHMPLGRGSLPLKSVAKALATRKNPVILEAKSLDSAVESKARLRKLGLL